MVDPSQHHLKRLDRIFSQQPIYFVTACTWDRRRLLTQPEAAAILLNELQEARTRRGWAVGRYVFMPDHMHFFCAEVGGGAPATLSEFVGHFKQWTSKRISRQFKVSAPIWQSEFFDHVLRSSESYESKWAYARDNPVRAGLVDRWKIGLTLASWKRWSTGE